MAQRNSGMFTLVLQMVNFFLSPMQYFPLLAGCGLSHSRSAYFNPPPQDLLQVLIGPHLPQPPWMAAGRAPMSTHSLCMHHCTTDVHFYYAFMQKKKKRNILVKIKNLKNWELWKMLKQFWFDFLSSRHSKM